MQNTFQYLRIVDSEPVYWKYCTFHKRFATNFTRFEPIKIRRFICSNCGNETFGRYGKLELAQAKTGTLIRRLGRRYDCSGGGMNSIVVNAVCNRCFLKLHKFAMYLTYSRPVKCLLTFMPSIVVQLIGEYIGLTKRDKIHCPAIGCIRF